MSPRAKLGLGGPVWVLIVLGSEQAEEERQADHPPADARQGYDQHDHHEAVAPARALPGPLWLGAVVQVVRAVYAPSGASEQRVVDGQRDRRVWSHEHRDQEPQQPQAQLVGLPAPVGEEGVRAAVVPDARKARPLQHPRDGVLADAGDEPDREHAEGLKAGCREARCKQGQQPGERTGYGSRHGGDLLGGAAAEERHMRSAASWRMRPPFGVAADPPA